MNIGIKIKDLFKVLSNLNIDQELFMQRIEKIEFEFEEYRRKFEENLRFILKLLEKITQKPNPDFCKFNTFFVKLILVMDVLIRINFNEFYSFQSHF